jgi:hypothetical protein
VPEIVKGKGKGRRLTEMSSSHWFIVARTPSGLAVRLGRDTGDAVMRLLVRARMMVVENFMVTEEERIVELGFECEDLFVSRE